MPNTWIFADCLWLNWPRFAQVFDRICIIVYLNILGIRWTVSQLIMQGDEQPSPLRHPLDMVAHVQPYMLLTILPVVLVVEGTTLFGGF